ELAAPAWPDLAQPAMDRSPEGAAVLQAPVPAGGPGDRESPVLPDRERAGVEVGRRVRRALDSPVHGGPAVREDQYRVLLEEVSTRIEGTRGCHGCVPGPRLMPRYFEFQPAPICRPALHRVRGTRASAGQHPRGQQRG